VTTERKGPPPIDPNDPRPYWQRLGDWSKKQGGPPPPRTEPPAVRSVEEVEAFLAWLPTSHYATNDRSYYAGVLATIEWAAGRRRLAPVTGREQAEGERPSGYNIGGEHSTAYEGMSRGAAAMAKDYGRFAPETITSAYSHSYFTAVEHSTYWLLGSDGLDVPEDWAWPRRFMDRAA
jgi:hypothetical protein